MSGNKFLNYSTVLHELKEKIKQARVRAVLSVNKELLQTYWDIGRIIAQQEKTEGWGAGIVKSLSSDLRMEFPDMQGISPRNLRYMRDFALAYPYFPILQEPPAKLDSQVNSIENQDSIILQAPLAKLEKGSADHVQKQQSSIVQAPPAKLKCRVNSIENQNAIIVQAPPAKLESSAADPVQKQKSSIVQEPLAQLTWYHHLTLLDKVKDPAVRQFYITKTIENGWSRNMMVHWIESGLHLHQRPLTTNFSKTIAPDQSELLEQLFKDPYNFDFLQMTTQAKERDLENALILHIKKFLLELGDGFAFMGQQYKMWAGDKEYIIDLLFYHTKLRRYIVIELKIGDFEAEFVGKMNLYLGIADDILKGMYDENSIGLILCKTKDKVVAEYALRDNSKPIGISEYKITQGLPENIKGELPSIEELEQKMDEELNDNINPIDARLRAVKNKLKNISNDEIQTPVTKPILTELYYKGLRPLYQLIIDKFANFSELFHDYRFEWYHRNKHVLDLKQLDKIWKDEFEMPMNNEIFEYRLLGFRKAGTENYSAQIRLQFEINTYWYRFSVINDNNNTPFLKKLYHQGLSDEEKQNIVDYLANNILDQIEHIIGRIEEPIEK